jgi:hypothetical protein
VGHVVHSDASGPRNIDALFFLLLWTWCSFYKKRVETRYVQLVFFHPVGFAGHVVHSGASGERNVITLFFKLGWDQYNSTKSAPGHMTPNFSFCIRWDLRSHSAFRCIQGMKRDHTIAHAQG